MLYPIQTLWEKRCFVPGISLSFEYECYIIMQIQHTKNLNYSREICINYNIELAD